MNRPNLGATMALAMSVLPNTLVDYLTCPVHLGIPVTGPVYECRNHHLICKECFVQLAKPAKCPLCRVRYAVTNGSPPQAASASRLSEAVQELDSQLGKVMELWLVVRPTLSDFEEEEGYHSIKEDTLSLPTKDNERSRDYGSLLEAAVDEVKKPTLLHRACQSGHLTVVKFLLESGRFDINSRQSKHGRTPLHLACAQGYPLIAAHLIKNGASKARLDASGKTPQDLAAISYSLNVMDVLMVLQDENADGNNNQEGGARADAIVQNCDKQRGIQILVDALLQLEDNPTRWSPLHRACSYGHLEVVSRLLQSGQFDVNARRGRSGQTPLHLAVMNRRVLVVKLLLEQGARKDIKDRNQKTAVDLVPPGPDGEDIADCLRKHNRSMELLSALLKYWEGNCVGLD